MRLLQSRILAMFIVLTLASVAHATEDDDDLRSAVKEQETIQKSFPLSGTGPRSLEIDNVYGSIEVVGSPQEQVQIVVTKTIRAKSQTELERAKKEVTLDVQQHDNALRLYVDGPFRCDNNCCSCSKREWHYVVKYDFKVRVPERINLKVKTVNEGTVHVEGVRGDYSVGNVNGPIDMEEVAGSGRVQTINGRVRVTFRENPAQDSEFTTINGNVDLYFAPKLAADFRFKTMQGGIYSDFSMTEIPLQSGKAERRDGKFVFRADRYTGARVGAGGPEIKLENLNGDLRVLARTNQ